MTDNKMMAARALDLVGTFYKACRVHQTTIALKLNHTSQFTIGVKWVIITQMTPDVEEFIQRAGK